MARFLFLLLTLGVLGSCAKPRGSTSDKLIFVEPQGSEFTLLLFAAPPCKPCNEELPQVYQAATQGLLKDKMGKLGITVFVETERDWMTSPTAKSANQYGYNLGVGFEMIPDLPEIGTTTRLPPWTTFRKYIGNQLALPAAVVLDKDKKPVKVFKTATVADIIDFLLQALP